MWILSTLSRGRSSNMVCWFYVINTVFYILLFDLVEYVLTEVHIESDNVKPKWDKVNRGVWINNKRDSQPGKMNSGRFIFRPNSLEADNQVQNSYYSFEKVNYEETPLYDNMYRRKRSAEIDSKRSLIKNPLNLKESITSKINQENTPFKLLTKIRPASVFNDYPYQVAVIIDDRKKDDVRDSNTNMDISDNVPVNIIISDVNYNTTKDKNDYESKIIKKIELTENLNKTHELDDDIKNSRDVFDIKNYDWPYTDKYTSYKNIPKGESKNKSLNEKGILKLLSVITKSFKKIVKQHEHIRQIYRHLINIKGDVVAKSAAIMDKIRDFDLKYINILRIFEKIKLLENSMSTRDEYYRKKEKELAQNFLDFEDKQKKFLMQQEQFYNIQKILITQNEKINNKQNIIAKTQSDIAHKQNNFARFIKKSRQFYTEKSPIKVNKANVTKNFTMLNTNKKSEETQGLKLNLLNITRNYLPVKKNDKLILQDKDSQPVDELVYKHYFNNTFIDHLMKSKILKNNQDDIDKKQVIKRSETDLNSTVLLPVHKTVVSFAELLSTPLHRERRWINHHSKLKASKKFKGKNQFNYSMNDGVNLEHRTPHVVKAKVENNPFVVMATDFCKRIKQNVTDQMLKWCVEKSLRRLKVMDITEPTTIESETKPKHVLDYSQNENIPKITTANYKDRITINSSGTELTTQTIPSATATTTLSNTPMNLPTAPSNFAIYFPDNDELESNLKQYDTKPDPEGNIYYDGSLHASDLVNSEDDDFSDIIPNLDSNSRIDVDPIVFDVALRRQYLKKFGYKKKA